MNKTAENRDINRKKKIFWITGAVFAVLLAVSILCPQVYYLNDDVAIRSILSGSYTGRPDGHAIYMKYPLTGVISLLYKLAGGVPWFELFMGGFFLLSISVILCRGREMIFRIHRKAGEASEPERVKHFTLFAILAVFCGLLFLPHYIAQHYTIVAAMLGGAAIFLVVTAKNDLGEDRRTHLEKSLLPVAMLILCYCIRSQVFFLLVPFWGAALLWQLCSGTVRLKLSGIYQQVVCVVVCVALCSVWNEAMYSSSEWQDYKIYNERRTSLYDYGGFVPFETYQMLYEISGIGQDEYNVMEQYNISLDQTIDGDVMGRAAELFHKVAGDGLSMTQKLKESLKEYYYQIRYSSVSLPYLMLSAYLALLIFALKQKSIKKFLMLLSLGAGRSLIWVYLIYKGRFPERISTSLYILEGMLLAGLLLGELTMFHGEADGRKHKLPEKDTSVRWSALAGRIIPVGIMAGFLLWVLTSGISQFMKSYGDAEERKENQLAWKAMQEYCSRNIDSRYLLDVYSMVGYAGELYEKLPDFENYMLMGGWLVRSPLMMERLEEMGATDGALALGQGEKVFLIAGAGKDVSWLGEYMDRRFGNCSFSKEDTINLGNKEVMTVYSIQVIQER